MGQPLGQLHEVSTNYRARFPHENEYSRLEHVPSVDS